MRPHLVRNAIRAALSDPTSVCVALELVDGARVQPGGLMIRCPWHEDRTPSCSVTSGADGTLRVHCFGCGVSGDAFTLIAQVRGLDVKAQFPAVLAAAEEVATELETGNASAVKPAVKRPTQPTLSVDVFDRVARTMFAEAPLSASSAVSNYLAGRRLLQEAANNGWGALPFAPLGVKQVIGAVTVASGADAWALSGMCGPDGAITFPANVILIPWRNPEGRITTVQRRAITPDGKPKYVFPVGRSATEPYGIEQLATADAAADVAFVEGAVDALAYTTLCKRYSKPRIVLGLPGASSWRSAWGSYAIGRVVHLALDADEVGDRAAERVAGDLHAAGALRVLRQRPRGAKDWAELLQKEAP